MHYLTAFIVTLMVLFASPSSAQIFSGQVKVIDGDTIDMTGQRIRLFGIDALEISQTCTRSAHEWACGKEAAQALSSLVSAREIHCEQRGWDNNGTLLAICTADGSDVAEVLLRSGLAIVLPKTASGYADVESWARERKSGIWSGIFENPAQYRAAHPREFAQPTKTETPRKRMGVRLRTNDVFFQSCAQAWAAGYAPIYKGNPGYRAEFDGDNDGIACEPARGRGR